MRPETNFPLRQWPLSTPPLLRTWPLSRYEVVVPAMVIFTLGIAPELAHEAVLTAVIGVGGSSERSKFSEFCELPVSVSTSVPCAFTVWLDPHRP